MKINSIEFSIWYKELTFNPIDKINDLEQALTSKFTTPFLVNNREPYVDIALPRIVGNNKENDTLFDMTLINLCYQRRYHDNVMMQDAIMEINENLQYFYDVLKDIYEYFLSIGREIEVIVKKCVKKCKIVLDVQKK
mgnify:CR=1 FL=1